MEHSDILLKQPGSRLLKRGVLIAIEGIDGAGKTTQAKLLRKNLEGRWYQVASFKEPTQSESGMKIRELGKNGRTVPVQVEFDLFLEDRRFDVEHNIRPALESGKIVVVDRYYYSSMAYQGARKMSPERVEKANLEFAPKPDLAILLDISPQTAKQRIQSRNEGKNHFEESLAPVREIFRQTARTHSEVREVSGEKDVEAVQSEIVQLVLPVVAKYQE
jgi:dTMP kinase